MYEQRIVDALSQKKVKTGLATNTLIANHVCDLTNELIKERLEESDDSDITTSNSGDEVNGVEMGSPTKIRKSKVSRKDQPQHIRSMLASTNMGI